MQAVRMPPPNSAPQLAFFKARSRYLAYGGARGGGKSWAVRWKAALMAAKFAGIKILILRRTYPELNENHILPMRQMLQGAAKYTDSEKAMTFLNGSRIKFGYCKRETDVLQYQGQEYDVIFLDEATQFTEWQFKALDTSVRGVNSFPKRFYLTCNPGGVGHAWVKRLFVDLAYRAGENPDDYEFIQARVYDNKSLLEADPGYLDTLKKLPEHKRRAWLDGDWSVVDGAFFPEWDRDVHVVEPFAVPAWWKWYFCIDYGLDMLAAYMAAADEAGNIGSLAGMAMRLHVEIGGASYWSELNEVSTADALISKGIITDPLDYLERVPDGYIKDKAGLIESIEAQRRQAEQLQQAQAMMQMGMGAGGMPAGAPVPDAPGGAGLPGAMG